MKAKKGLTELRTILFAMIAALPLAACGWFGPAEKYKTESGRTTYRAADESPASTIAPESQKIPGEKKK